MAKYKDMMEISWVRDTFIVYDGVYCNGPKATRGRNNWEGVL